MKQEIRFCTAPDGARLAYATHGSGPPLVKAGNWLTHLEYDWESPIWRHWLRDLGATNTMIRYDDRGCGLSERELPAAPTLDTFVGDLQAVVDAAGPERFALLSISGGGAAAVTYATRHPERLSHLVIYGGYARGRFGRDELQRQQSEALISLMRVGWGQNVPALRRLFTSMWAPGASEGQLRWWDDLQRKTTTGENAAKLWNARAQLDVTDVAGRVTTPTLLSVRTVERHLSNIYAKLRVSGKAARAAAAARFSRT